MFVNHKGLNETEATFFFIESYYYCWASAFLWTVFIFSLDFKSQQIPTVQTYEDPMMRKL